MNRNRFLALGLETGERVVQQILSILLLFYIWKDPLLVLVSYAITSLIFFYINNYYYKIHFQDQMSEKNEITHNYDKEVINYTWPFALLGLFYWIQNASERWVLAFFENTDTVGKYSVINQIGFQSFTLFMGAIGYFITPIIFNRAGSLDDQSKFESAHDINNKQLIMVIIITVIAVFVTCIFSKEILILLSDKKYLDVAPLLPLMTLAGGLFNYGQVYANKFLLSLQSNSILLPRIASSIFGLLMNLLLIYYFGLYGLLAAILCTQAIYIALLRYKWKSIKIPS